VVVVLILAVAGGAALARYGAREHRRVVETTLRGVFVVCMVILAFVTMRRRRQ